MVRVQKNKLLLAGICAVSFFGKQAQASNFCKQVRSSAVSLASSANDRSTAMCQSVASHVPGLILTSVLLETAQLTAQSIKNRSIQKGDGCPIGGLINDNIAVTITESTKDVDDKDALTNSVKNKKLVGVRVGRVAALAQLPHDAKNRFEALVNADYGIQLPSFRNMAATLVTYLAFQKFVAKK